MVVPNDGVVVACCSGECGTKTRVDAATLQKLADKLEAKCYNCGAPLKSIAKPHGNVLNCGTGCPNNTWERLNDRLEAKS
jgi:predicted nucleic acid-binding Zn ribbon protein